MAEAGIYLTIFTPQKVLYEGNVESLSSINRVGKFDVMIGHANFISLISERLTVRTGKDIFEVMIESGVMRVSQGRVDVFVREKAEAPVFD